MDAIVTPISDTSLHSISILITGALWSSHDHCRHYNIQINCLHWRHNLAMAWLWWFSNHEPYFCSATILEGPVMQPQVCWMKLPSPWVITSPQRRFASILKHVTHRFVSCSMVRNWFYLVKLCVRNFTHSLQNSSEKQRRRAFSLLPTWPQRSYSNFWNISD